MTTGVQCTIDPQCRHPAPAESRICHERRKQIRLAAMRRSPSVPVRVLGHVVTLLADREAGS
jgi:hypothetical protein